MSRRTGSCAARSRACDADARRARCRHEAEWPGSRSVSRVTGMRLIGSIPTHAACSTTSTARSSPRRATWSDRGPRNEALKVFVVDELHGCPYPRITIARPGRVAFHQFVPRKAAVEIALEWKDPSSLAHELNLRPERKKRLGVPDVVGLRRRWRAVPNEKRTETTQVSVGRTNRLRSSLCRVCRCNPCC